MILKQFYLLILTVGCMACYGGESTHSGGDQPIRSIHDQVKTDSVTGQFKENYRVLHLSAGLQRLLFVLNKGSLYLPENGFFLHLNASDAQRLGAADIIIIPLFAERSNIFYEYDQDLTFEIVPIPGLKNGYYTKNSAFFQAHNTIKVEEQKQLYAPAIFESPSLKDTIVWANFADYNDLRDIPKWIDKLHSQEQVTVHHIGCVETTTGGFSTHDFQSESLSEFAKQRLGYVSNSMELLGAPKPEAGQQAWRQWIDSIIQAPLQDQLFDSGNEQLSITFDQSSAALLALDDADQQIIRLHPQPHYTNYKDQQVVSVDLLHQTIQADGIYAVQQKEASEFEDFFAAKDTLFTLNKQFVWGKYFPSIRTKDAPSFYKQLTIKTLIPERGYTIDNSRVTRLYTYILYHKDKESQYKLLVCDTRTGTVLSKRDLHTILNDAQIPIGKLEYQPFTALDKTSNDFALLIKSKESVYHIRLDQNLKCIDQQNLGSAFPWYPSYICTATKQFYFNQTDNQMSFYPISVTSADIVQITLADRMYDNYTVVEDGQHIRLFYEYGDAFTHGIKTILLDGNSFKPIGPPEFMFSQVQLETESSENTPSNLQAFKINDTWRITFMIDNEFYVASQRSSP
jgi:hypothetical protein